MKLLKTSTYEIQKSIFMAYYYEVTSKDEIKAIWESLKKEHKKARHIPYAYLLKNTAGKSDDKEPSGTSGTPIFKVLERSQEINRAIFIVRYFGGTKLGASGLTRAYRTSASSLFEKEKNIPK